MLLANLESRGWLSLLEIDHPPPTTLIREFFSIISCHVYDSNTLVWSLIRGVEFTITPRVVAEALGVPVVTDPVYPYNKSPPIDVVMSHITGSSIQWWTFLMRFVVCEHIWHDLGVLHPHIFLMMDFDYSLAFPHKKGEYI